MSLILIVSGKCVAIFELGSLDGEASLANFSTLTSFSYTNQFLSKVDRILDNAIKRITFIIRIPETQ